MAKSNPEKIKAICQMSSDGKTNKEIAEFYNHSTGYISGVLTKNGIHQRELPSDATIIASYQKTLSSYKTAEELGTSQNSVLRALSRNNIKATGLIEYRQKSEHENAQRYPREIQEVIKNLYNSGVSLSELKDRFGGSRDTLRKVIRRMDGELRPAVRPFKVLSQEDQDKILELHGQGKTQHQIYEEIGHTPRIVSRVPKSNGVHTGKPSDYYEQQIVAFGERKTFREWSKDPRCKVGLRKLVQRVLGLRGKRHPPEVAMQREDKLNRRKSKCGLSNEEIAVRCQDIFAGQFPIINQFGEYYSMLGIYGIFNTENGKLYVGQASSEKSTDGYKGGIGRRLCRHQRMLGKVNHDNQHLQASYDKYGESSFAYILLEPLTGETPDKITERETYWVEHFNTMNKHYGYNINHPTNGRTGIISRPLTIPQIKEWIKKWIEEFGKPPTTASGVVPYDDRVRGGNIRGGQITWAAVNQSLQNGSSGLPGGTTLKELVYEILEKPYEKKTLPRGIHFSEGKYVVRIGQGKIGRFPDQQTAEIALASARAMMDNGIPIEQIRKNIQQNKI